MTLKEENMPESTQEVRSSLHQQPRREIDPKPEVNTNALAETIGDSSSVVQRPATALVHRSFHPAQRHAHVARVGRVAGNYYLQRMIQRQDGSGTHGAQQPGLGNRLSKQLWYRVADAAESLNMTNAARHMRHYLNNTGATLRVNVGMMLRDLPGLQARLNDEIDRAKDEANQRIATADRTKPIDFSLTGQRRNYYASKGESADWYFAIGGMTYWYTARVQVRPVNGKAVVRMSIQLHVFDRYNWDQGKSVTIAGVTVSDETLGELHKRGLAREFLVEGVSGNTTVSWTYSGSSAPNGAPPTAGAREGARSDRGRDRSSDRRQDRELRDTPNRTRR